MNMSLFLFHFSYGYGADVQLDYKERLSTTSTILTLTDIADLH